MNIVLRNFFYAVGFTVLFALHGLDANNAQFADLVRLAQSAAALKMVLALVAILVGLELVLGTWGFGSHRPALIVGYGTTGNASSWKETDHKPVPLGGDTITYATAAD